MKSSNVTVIIPCYNDGIYLKQAMDSLISQTLKAVEIIIVDDGSDKATKEILGKFSYANTKIITQENQGLSKARNNGIALSETDYVLTLDADDHFEPTFIEKAVKVLEQNEKIGVVGCYFRWFNEENDNLRVINTTGGEAKDFLFGNKGIANSLFRRICWEQVGGYDEKMVHGYEDWEFWIAITSLGWEYGIIKEILFNYRRKNVSMLLTALEKYDLEIKRYIFKKHHKLYAMHIEETIDYFFNLLEKEVNQREKAFHSMDYKLGEKILSPIRMIKRKL